MVWFGNCKIQVSHEKLKIGAGIWEYGTHQIWVLNPILFL